MRAQVIKLPITPQEWRPWAVLGATLDIEESQYPEYWHVLKVTYVGNYQHIRKADVCVIEEEPNGWDTP